MRRIVSAPRWLCFLLCFWVVTQVVAAPASEETWYSVHLDGRKIGHMRSLRAVEADGRVRHEQALVLSVERNKNSLRIATEERSWESATGKPLAFETRIDTAGSVARTYGTVRAGGDLFDIRAEVQGQVQEQTLQWPKGALLPEGLRLAAEREGFAPGTRYSAKAFDAGSLQALRIRTRVGPPEDVEMHGRTERLIVLDQVLEMGGVPTETRAWVTPDTHDLRRLRLPAIGLPLEMLACDRACALAPVQPTDVFASTLVESPRALGSHQLLNPLRYHVRLRRGEGVTLGQAPGQELRALEARNEYALTVDPRGDDDDPPSAADLEANRWLQSADESVVALARRATRDVQGRVAQAELLERFVRGYISTKSLRVGYASASEIVRGREGDCTEHAVLLAAMMRALGIPARVATGIAYTSHFGDKRQVFVPHAWVVAWVGDEWRGFDAALSRFDAGHIAFSIGDGDPFRFYGGVELLGGMEILAIERVPRRALSEAAE